LTLGQSQGGGEVSWRRIIITTFTVVLSLNWLASASSARAAGRQIVYSWHGSFLQNDIDDPWHFGGVRLPFELELRVDVAAADLALGIDTALFAVEEARLVVDGQEVSYVGDGYLDITDNHSDRFDLMTFHGLFERNGVQTRTGSLVALPLDGLHFEAQVEMPPLFGRIANDMRSGTGGPLYGTWVEKGAAIAGVPEPQSICLALSALLLLRVLRVRKRSLH
jgi:hypothetical protein